MKKQLLIILYLVISSGGSCQKPPSDSVEGLMWIIGRWERTNGKPGSTSFENWEKVSQTELKGTGITMKGSDTVFVEKIGIVLQDGHLRYMADVPENKSVVYFPFTAIQQNGFVCENAAHDFPKKITYVRKDRELTAVISGDGKSITYIFKRIRNP
jgi:hypothetical protein